jgi:hypothetical protein
MSSGEPKTRRRGGLALVLGLVALGAAFVVAFRGARRATPPVSLTAERSGTTRAAVAASLVRAGAARGLDAHLVETASMSEALDEVNAGRIDLALVSGVSRLGEHPQVREVAPLYVEALHLLVKQEIADAVAESLGALRGRRVAIGASGSVTAGLAMAVLAFAGLDANEGAARQGVVVDESDLRDLMDRVARGDRQSMPDAIFRLETIPSKVVLTLVREAEYRLVALPFADALRLSALISEASGPDDHEAIDQEYVTDIVIPPFTYGTEPAIPPAPMHTVGTRLLLVGNAQTPARAVEAVLDAVFGSRFARVAVPPLDESVLARPARLSWHPATLAYVQRDEPILTRNTVSGLSSTFSVLGTLLASALFLRRWWQQRRQGAREETFASCIVRVASIERKVARLELGATLELEPLVALQHELLELKSEALESFVAGEIGGDVALSELLTPINAARDHMASLLLHLRETLEEQAEAEGRTAQAVWTEAMSKPPQDAASTSR